MSPLLPVIHLAPPFCTPKNMNIPSTRVNMCRMPGLGGELAALCSRSPPLFDSAVRFNGSTLDLQGIILAFVGVYARRLINLQLHMLRPMDVFPPLPESALYSPSFSSPDLPEIR